jgi:arginine N-succinyltransferase
MTMMLFRSARESDLEGIHYLAEHSGIGITTLPKNIDLLKQRLARSTASFNKTIDFPHDEYYLFTLEDPASGKVVGTSAIEAVTGYDAPIYSYKLSKRTRVSNELKIRSDYEVMSLVNDNQGHSEICTLFLDPDFRINNNGLLLSRARFLFINNFPHRFAPNIIAEMRGISDDEGNSPFWDQVGYHFFHMSFAEADRLTISTNKQFIADLMPRHPIYVKLLSSAAQAVIGKPHASTIPAMNILLREGFRYNNYVDIFDAGPTIEAPRDQIRTIAASKLLTIQKIIDDVSSKNYIIANTRLDYRATISQVIFNEENGSCIISHDTADILQVKKGDAITISPLQAADSPVLKKEHHGPHASQ